MKKFLALSAAAVLTLGAIPGAFAADVIPINPQGAGGTIQVGALDFNVGNGLAVADTGQTLGAGGRFAGQQFTFYAQATLANFNDQFGTPIAGTGLNSTFEYTVVAGFREEIINPGINLTFNTLGGAANPLTNFFQIYYDPSRNANNLTGLGFTNGTLILEGHILAGPGAPFSNSNFSISSIAPGQALDQFGADNYGGLTTITGQGGGAVNVAVDFALNTFFPTAPTIIQQNFTTLQALAFNQTDPSACFFNGAGSIGGAGGQGTGCPNTIGTFNGVSGNNLQLQLDSNSSFTTRVPEPGSLALVGLAVVGLGLSRRRYHKKFNV